MRIPISVKLIFITALLLVGVTVPIAIQSSNEFEANSVQRERAINSELAESRAKQIENILANVTDKIILSARMLHSTTQTVDANSQTHKDFEVNFNNDSDMISLQIYKIEGSAVQMTVQKIKEKNLEPFKLNKNYITTLRQQQQFPFRAVTEGKGKIILMNSSGPEKRTPSMVTVGVPLFEDPVKGIITHIALADVNLSILQAPFTKKTASTFFLTDQKGVLLAHSKESYAIAKYSMAGSEIFQFAQKSQMATATKDYTDATKKSFLGAFAKTRYGVTVFSQIETEKVLAPSQGVRIEAFKIAGYFLSGTLFLVFLFSLSLTSPLEKLVSLIEFVSKGNFDVKATKEVKGLLKDEVTELAIAFDHMTDGLKERDKVKNLFNKFHGSSVTEDLMKGDVGLGGQSKDVVVFFSDIRGFTAFSEKRSPEEVVEMLNEYFGVMVGIINKHGGVVDKFIGDAIMAIWGAPKTTDRDPHNAVRACLEMRKALEELNAKREARQQPPLQIGMGLHAGKAISGTIGSSERMEYTVIGNTVNTGSRIEAATKAFGADLLISDTVLEKVGDEFKTEYAGAAEVKGRSEPLKLHKVRGYKAENGEYIDVKTAFSDYEAEKADKVKIAA